MTVSSEPTSRLADARSIPVTQASAGPEFGSAPVGSAAAPVTAAGVRPTLPSVGTVAGSPSPVGSSAPRLDLIETPDEILLTAELPGYDEDDILLEAIDQQIRIFAERDDEEIENGYAHLRERPSKVERTVALPAPVDIERADATFEDGICHIEIPKIEESGAHRIGFH